ncbi:MAG: hypothetical protein Q4G05_03710 [Clostridia bacterium]|nr:hypothetical protein [Clostridia bacterium]
MKQFFNLLKATSKGDMNIFKINLNGKSNSNIFKKIITFLLILFIIGSVFTSIGFYAYSISEPLHKVNLTFIALSIFMLISVVMVFMEGVYKSQGILFDAKDNDLVFSMPIPKRTILGVRMVKLLIFQYIFTLLFSLPALAIYIYFENPGISFYIVSLIMIILLPVIPTLLGCVFGYLIKASSSLFRNKRTMQTIFSLVFTAIIFTFSFKMQGFIESITSKATSINDVITKIYFPIGLYIKCVQEFNILTLFQLILSNIIIAILFVYIFSISYYKIISKSSENSVSSRNKKYKIKTKSALSTLISKELRTYFGSAIYIFNTAFGLVLILLFVFNFIFNKDNTINTILQSEGLTISTDIIMQWFSKLYIALLLFVIPTVTITASSISLEGKSFYLLKTIPVDTRKIFLAKIMTSNIIAIPVLLFSSLILICAYKFAMIECLFILLLCLIFPTLTAILGLVINLAFPLLNAKSDTVVVKQSKSSLFSILAGFILGIAPVVLYFMILTKIDLDVNLYISLLIAFYFILTCILWKVLNTFGVRRFREIY